MSKEETSGIICLKQDLIFYELSTGGWQIPVSEIKIIGEHTDDQGPLIDDYFLVFLTDSDLYEASFYAEGVELFLQELSDRLGASLSCELCNSTDYRSRVIWPPDMEGAALFDYFARPKPKGLFARLKDKFFPETFRKLSDSVHRRLKLI